MTSILKPEGWLSLSPVKYKVYSQMSKEPTITKTKIKLAKEWEVAIM